jgi:hypothetical protein
LVFTPTPGATATCRVFNEGQNVVYVGQAGITPANGLPIQPNCKIELPNVVASLYCAAGYSTTATATTLTAAANAGATTLAVTSGVGIANGGWVAVGSGANLEVVQVTAGGGTATLTVTALTYDHKTAAAVTAVNSLSAQARITAGVV